MTDTVQWDVTVDAVTDALVRSHLAKTPAVSMDAFVMHAVEREMNRIALLDHEHATVRPAASDDMWEIVIPRPR